MTEDELQQAQWDAEKRALADVLARHAIELEMAYPLSACPVGWIPIVDELLRELAARGCHRVAQIKEKFGQLRVYLPGGEPAEVQALVSRAEERSGQTCQRCGAPGQGRSARGWLSTTCDACAAAARREKLLAASARVMAAHDETFRKLAQ